MTARVAAPTPAGIGPGRTALLSCRGLTKTYASTTALVEVGFAVHPGEIVALCGENGAGKSTLVKIVTGLVGADQGTVSVDGVDLPAADPRAALANGVALVDQELSLLPDLSVYDNIWIGNRRTPVLHRRRALRAKARALLNDLGCSQISLDALAGSLTLGERQLVEIARMLAREARILILDEPTATLSDVEIARIFAALRSLAAQGRSVLFVSHRLAEVFELCSRTIVFRNGRLVADGATAHLDRGKLVALMLGRQPADLYPDRAPSPGEVVAEVTRLSVPGRLDELSMSLRAGQIVGIAGQLGSGAGTVVRALAGLEPTVRGSLTVSGRRVRPRTVAAAAAAGIRYLPEDRAGEGLFLECSVQHNLTVLRLPQVSTGAVLRRGMERAVAKRLAETVTMQQGRLRHDVGTLSGGNQQKVAVGRLLDLPTGTVLLLHEPTRGVDVGSRAEIYRIIDALARSGYAVLVVSTDLEELIGLCDRIHTLYRGRVVGEHAVDDFDSNRILGEITHGTVGAVPVFETEAQGTR